jgi:DNA-directed RNA polymerase beta subunit
MMNYQRVLVRSPSVYFKQVIDKNGRSFYTAELIPSRGTWLEFEMDARDIIYVRVDRTRKVTLTTLLRAFGLSKDEDIINLVIGIICYNDKTKDYSCNKLSKPPHVCNGCKSRSGCRKEREIRVGRTYDDFIEYTSKNADLNIVEMDTVEGLKSDSKCILTIFWRKSNFRLMFLLEKQTTEEVTKIKKIFITENYKYQTDK